MRKVASKVISSTELVLNSKMWLSLYQVWTSPRNKWNKNDLNWQILLFCVYKSTNLLSCHCILPLKCPAWRPQSINYPWKVAINYQSTR